MTPLLTINNLRKQYDAESVALSDVSFSVNEGEFVSIIGSSGAGKSTLLRCINRMVEATEGEIIFDGADVNKKDKARLRQLRTKIGMIFQHYNLVNRLTVLENVLHGRLGYKSTLAGSFGIYTSTEKQQAFKIIEILGLEKHVYKRCDQLSGGQKQRVGIARALIQDPKMLLCDEPIASLDPNASKIIMDHLKNISSTMGITCLVNLHQVTVALKYSDRVIGIKNGKKVYDGSPRDISSKQVHDIYESEAGELILDIDEQVAEKNSDKTVNTNEI